MTHKTYAVTLRKKDTGEIFVVPVTAETDDEAVLKGLKWMTDGQEFPNPSEYELTQLERIT